MVEFAARRGVPALSIAAHAASSAAAAAATPATQYAGGGGESQPGAAVKRRTAPSSFELPSPTAASAIGGRSLLYEPLPADLLWPVRPQSPTVAPLLNIAVNRRQLLKAVDAHIDAALEGSTKQSEAKGGKTSGKKAQRRAVRNAGQSVEQLVDEQCAAAASFHYQQQLRLDVSSRPQRAASAESESRVADAVRALTASGTSAHRYRLYTDSLIDVGLHHEAELRRQWVAMETQARSINRSAERAARRDMRETVREIVNAARAGKGNEVHDKLKEATQHVDEANEARNSRAAIYTDGQLYLPLSRSSQRTAAVLAGMAGEKSSVGHLHARQPLFDPVPQTKEFERGSEQRAQCHNFRDDDRAAQRSEAEVALPAVVEHVTRAVKQAEEEREARRKAEDSAARVLRAERRRQKRQRVLQQRQLAASEQRRRLKTPPEPRAPPSTAEPLVRGRTAVRPQTSLVHSRLSTAATRRSSAIRAPLWTQGQGDAMLAEVSQFTLLRDKEEERRKREERAAIAEEERRTRQQWLADEQREAREREEKEQEDKERRLREQQEDEREDEERRLRFFPQRLPPNRLSRAHVESEESAQPAVESAEREDDSGPLDSFKPTSPLPPAISRSPERLRVSLSASDTLQPRRSSIAAGPGSGVAVAAARRISVTAAEGLPGILHRRQSSVLPPPSPALSSTRASSSSRSYRSSLSGSAFPASQVRSRWQNAAGKTGKEHLARRFSLVAASDSTQQQPQQQQQSHSHSVQYQVQAPSIAAMLPAPIDPDSSLVATNYSHDPLHSAYLQQQRQQRRTATAQVYDTVKAWLEQREEERRNVTPAASQAATASGGGSVSSQRTASLSFDPQLVTPFSSLLAHQPYSPRTQQRHHTMRQQLPLSVSNPAVFAWMRRHAIVPRRTIDPSEEVKYRAMFNELDVNGNGLLDTSELLSALQATHNLRLSESELHALLTGMDIRFEGHLSFQQFVSQFASMDEWESLFRIWAKRRQKRMAAAAAAALQPTTARSRPQTSPPSDRPISPPFRHSTVPPDAGPLLTARPASSASIASLRTSSSSSSSRPSSSSRASSAAASPSVADVDVLVPFLLWVPAFHRLQLLDSLMAVQLTPEEEASVRASVELAQQQPVHSQLGAHSAEDGSSGLSLLDLWRVTRTQVRRKRMESDKAEAMRIKQLQAAETSRAAKGKGADGLDGGLGGAEAAEEKVTEIWLELHGERERRVKEKRKWRTAHAERKQRRQGKGSGQDSDTDGRQQRMGAFDLFKQAAQRTLGEALP